MCARPINALLLGMYLQALAQGRIAMKAALLPWLDQH
jgi:hypothetical protein